MECVMKIDECCFLVTNGMLKANGKERNARKANEKIKWEKQRTGVRLKENTVIARALHIKT